MNKEYWRNDESKIECPGDNCSNECTKACPIWLKTLGDGASAFGSLDEAINLYNEALKIAPDFGECWNNIGMCYGMQSEYLKAKEAYLNSFKIKKTQKALYGLAVTSKDLGEFDESLKYIKEYEKTWGNNSLEGVKNAIDGFKQYLKNSKHLKVLLNVAIECGWISKNNIRVVPMLVVKSMPIIEAIINEFKSQPDLVEAELSWFAIAGFGIVNVWKNNMKIVNETESLIKYLIDDRGIFALDDYVFEMVGIETRSDIQTEGYSKMQKYFQYPVQKILLTMKDINDKDDFLELAMDLFTYGIVLAFNYNK